jgi:hypothetical protein
MVFFKKPKSNSSVKGQLRNLLRDISFESAKEIREVGKEVIKGVTMLPSELLTGAKSESSNDWEKDWLKDQDKEKARPPLSPKEGGHSQINPAEFAKKNDQPEIEKVQRQLAQTLNQTYSHPSVASEYGQELARKRQSEQKSVYEKIWEERKEERERQAKAPQAAANLSSTGSKRQAGDWRHGTKRKRGPSPQELNRTEFAGKGKQ